MSAATVGALCERVRPELACLGELGASLLAVVGVVEATAGDRGNEVLADPSFALEVLLACGAEGDAAVVGRVLDFLRVRAGDHENGDPGRAALSTQPARRAVRVADAVASYESGALALMARGTQHTYKTWTRRLVAAHAGDDPKLITAGDLKDLIAHHVLSARDERDRRQSGRSAESMTAATK